jgi:hypothetical protein
MKPRLWLLLCGLLIWASVAAAQSLIPNDPTKATSRTANGVPQGSVQLLFIGNSLTYVNDLPDMLGVLFAANHQHVVLGQHTPGATSLNEHSQNPAVAKLISSRKWTFVVLQDQSVLPAENPAITLNAGKTLCDLVYKDGATPIYYLTWGYPSKEPPGIDVAMQRNLTKAYGAAARASKALLAPVGPAWQAALEKDPKIKLYAPNDYHPSPEGTYLTACVLYAVMTQRSPMGLPSTVTVRNKDIQQTLVNMPTARAQFYQQVAWDTVKNFSMEKFEADEAKHNAALPSVNDVQTKLKKGMTIAEVAKALGEAPDQRNDINHVYIFKMQDDAKLWITYGKDGTIATCQVTPKARPWQTIDLP